MDLVKIISERVRTQMDLHKQNKIFLDNVKGKIADIARDHGFDVSGLWLTDGEPEKILIGDIHNQPEDEEFLVYHPAIVEISKEFIGEGILKAGDHYCFEGGVEGTVDYERSHIESGNKSFLMMINEGIPRKAKMYDADHTIRLFPVLRDEGIVTVCTDSASFRRAYDGLISEAETALKTDEFEKAEKAIAESERAMIARVQRGFATKLKRIPGRAVQVCGAVDIFTHVIQAGLNAAGQSYIVLMPKDPKYK